jgi:hypothetical protein
MSARLARAAPPLMHLVAATALLTAATSPKTAAPCARAEYHQFDFFLGDWDAYDVGSSQVKAHGVVTRMLGQCAVRELYSRRDGYVGESFSVYDSARRLASELGHESRRAPVARRRNEGRQHGACWPGSLADGRPDDNPRDLARAGKRIRSRNGRAVGRRRKDVDSRVRPRVPEKAGQIGWAGNMAPTTAS